jgi:hypothetical protein
MQTTRLNFDTSSTLLHRDGNTFLLRFLIFSYRTTGNIIVLYVLDFRFPTEEEKIECSELDGIKYYKSS